MHVLANTLIVAENQIAVENKQRFQEELHKHSLWLYGVIVGLSIKEAVVNVVPHFFPAEAQTTAGSSSPDLFLEATRLLLFLTLISRFYLGAVQYFGETYVKPETGEPFTEKTYSVDFLFGFVHFLFFAALSLAIPSSRSPMVFPIIMTAILLYDFIWFLLCHLRDNVPMVRCWFVINIITCVFAAVIYLLFERFQYPPTTSQMLAFIPILLVSLLDIFEVTTGRDLIFKPFDKFLRSIGKKDN